MFKDEVSLSGQDVAAITYAMKSSAVYEGKSFELWKSRDGHLRNRCLQEIRRQARTTERLMSQWLDKRVGSLQARSVCESFRQGRRHQASKRR